MKLFNKITNIFESNIKKTYKIFNKPYIIYQNEQKLINKNEFKKYKKNNMINLNFKLKIKQIYQFLFSNP